MCKDVLNALIVLSFSTTIGIGGKLYVRQLFNTIHDLF